MPIPPIVSSPLATPPETSLAHRPLSRSRRPSTRRAWSPCWHATAPPWWCSSHTGCSQRPRTSNGTADTESLRLCKLALWKASSTSVTRNRRTFDIRLDVEKVLCSCYRDFWFCFGERRVHFTQSRGYLVMIGDVAMV
jgi:hypothetical protein